MNPQLTQQFDQIWGTKTPSPGAPSTNRANEIRSMVKGPDEVKTPYEVNTPASFEASPVHKVAEGVVNTGKALYDRASGIVKDTQDQAQKDRAANPNMNAGESVIRAGAAGVHGALSGIAGGVGDIFTNMVSPFIPQDVKDQASQKISSAAENVKSKLNEPATGEDLLHNQQFRDFLTNAHEKIQQNPELAHSIGDLFNVALLGGGKAAENAVQPAIEKGLQTGADATENIVQKVAKTGVAEGESSANTLIKETGKVTPETARTSAWKDISPKETPTTKLAYAKQGKATEQGMFTKGELKPSDADSKLLDSYQKLYEDGTIKDSMSPNEKQAAVQQKAAQLHGQQKDFLLSHDKAVNLNTSDKTGIFDKLDDMTKTNTVPFAKDASSKGAYDSAIDVFKSKVESGKAAATVKGATTISKLDKALTSFDAEMEKFGAWGKTKTGEISDTAMARKQAIRDVHTFVRDQIAENLPKNSPWKSIRSEESQLYEVSDRLAQRVADDVGESKAGQMIKDNPIIKTGVKAAGLGAGLHLVP